MCVVAQTPQEGHQWDVQKKQRRKNAQRMDAKPHITSIDGTYTHSDAHATQANEQTTRHTPTTRTVRACKTQATHLEVRSGVRVATGGGDLGPGSDGGAEPLLPAVVACCACFCRSFSSARSSADTLLRSLPNSTLSSLLSWRVTRFWTLCLTACSANASSFSVSCSE